MPRTSKKKDDIADNLDNPNTCHYYVLVPIPRQTVDTILKLAAKSKDLSEQIDLMESKTKLGNSIIDKLKVNNTKATFKTLHNTLSKQTKDLEKNASNLLKRLKNKASRRVFEKALYLEPTKDENVIKQINKHDVLYILAHGNTRALGSGDGANDVVELDAKLLAAELHAAGVSTELSQLKVLACNSGLLEENVDKENKTRMFVSELCKELYKLGYHDVEVHGYVGYMQESPHNQHSLAAPSYGGSSTRFRASQARVTVKGPEGAVIQIPTVLFGVKEYAEADQHYRWKQRFYKKPEEDKHLNEDKQLSEGKKSKPSS